MKYELTKDLETGNTVIDSEHRELFKAVNQLFDACGKGQGRTQIEPVSKFLTDYVNKHFKHEEQLQQSKNYPNFTAHRAFHENYKKNLNDIVSQISASGSSIANLAKLNSHIGILISHIRTEDKRLGEFLK